MNLRKTFLTLAIVMAAGTAMAEDATFNVATYNIRQLNDGDTRAGNGWSRRAPVVAQLIRFHDFDIFGTQEGSRRTFGNLLSHRPV